MSTVSAVVRVLDESVTPLSLGCMRAALGSNKSILIYLIVGGSTIPMHVLECDSIASVKLRIHTCKGFVVRKQKLVYGGRELARNDSRV
ncbi:hypothetical protein IFM89_034392 [Coptis chinensis]|uniref:Ubiquitin-like domain-containing protein n=1 Tax=Coptis chinensis TaxID=261450 RepID=A0A835J3I8_9MAGN|nr:hypothetical protein IFM89_034392 [Coptis chinensis]